MSDPHKLHVLVDLLAGSCGKGAVSPRLARHYRTNYASCHNLPNAGHTAIVDGRKFVSKAIPTPLILNHGLEDGSLMTGQMTGLISPGSGFHPMQIVKEWVECARPNLVIHDRAVLVLPEHAEAERSGAFSTKHVASTMQGSGTAVVGKTMRRPEARLARHLPDVLGEMVWKMEPGREREEMDETIQNFLDAVRIVDGALFRDLTFDILDKHPILHEGSQGYALSLNHGLPWPHTTSRDCDTMTAASYMGIPPQRVGDVWGLIRAGHMIRVGNVVENGKTVGESGACYPDQHEITWAELAESADMPEEEARKLTERELTTVTKRLRRVFTESRLGLRDAVRTCGVTHLAVNFLQYVNWEDHRKTEWRGISDRSRQYLASLEDELQVPVRMLGTGAEHHECIWL